MKKTWNWQWIILAVLMIIRFALNDQIDGTVFEVVWLSMVCLWFIMYCLIIRKTYAKQSTDMPRKPH